MKHSQHASALTASLMVAALSWGTAGCQERAPSAVVHQLPTELPMRFRGTEPAVEVLVNGQGPFLFAIDTGATDFARVDSSLAKRLALRTTGSDVTNDASGKNKKVFDTVRLASLTLAGIEFHDVTAMTRDYNRNPSLPHIDGILTFDLLSDYLLTLDYPRKVVRIERGELPPSDGLDTLELKRIAGLPAVEITIAGHRVTAEIDSGNVAAAFLVPSGLMKKLRLADKPIAAGRAKTVSNEIAIEEAHLDGTIRIGRYEFPSPVLTFPAPFNFPNIGSPTLRDFAVTFDQKHNRVRFVRYSDVAPSP